MNVLLVPARIAAHEVPDEVAQRNLNEEGPHDRHPLRTPAEHTVILFIDATSAARPISCGQEREAVMDDHSRAAGCRESSRACGTGGPGGAGGGCPYVERNDARCGHRFTLGRIDQAFTVCFGAYQGCPIYQCMMGQSEARPAASAANANVIPLRATGT